MSPKKCLKDSHCRDHLSLSCWQKRSCCQHLGPPNHKPHSCLSDLSTTNTLLLPHPSSSLPSALPPCSLSRCRVTSLSNEGPLCPACLSCVPWCSGAHLERSQTASALVAHYSHYIASNQCRTGCWDLSTTHKGPGSLVGLPVKTSIRKGVHSGRGTQKVRKYTSRGLTVCMKVTYFAHSNHRHRGKAWFNQCVHPKSWKEMKYSKIQM